MFKAELTVNFISYSCISGIILPILLLPNYKWTFHPSKAHSNTLHYIWTLLSSSVPHLLEETFERPELKRICLSDNRRLLTNCCQTVRQHSYHRCPQTTRLSSGLSVSGETCSNRGSHSQGVVTTVKSEAAWPHHS